MLHVFSPFLLVIVLTVKLFTDMWINGSVDRPKVRTWLLSHDSEVFQNKCDDIQEQLQDLCGFDDLLTGVLNKSKAAGCCLQRSL